MANLFDPQAAEMQNMRVEIAEMLHTSLLGETEKRSLMIILPHLPLDRLQPIHEKLETERRLQAEQLPKLRLQLNQITKEAWQMAEQNITPSPDQLDAHLLQQISQF